MYQRHLKLFKKYKILRTIYSKQWGKKLLFLFLGKKRDTRTWPDWVIKTDEERAQNLPQYFPGDAEKWIVTEKIDRFINYIYYEEKGSPQRFLCML